MESFTSPHAFLDHAKVHQPHIAIIDIRMPTMNGLEVQVRVSKVSPLTRVIFVTSDDAPNVRRIALRAGASAFLLKPIQQEEFLATVASTFFEDASIVERPSRTFFAPLKHFNRE